MKESQVTRTLLKKLSALRATLSDEEQYLLDSLLVGSYRPPKNETNGTRPAEPASSIPEAPNIRPALQPPGHTRASPLMRITFDQELEIYLIE